jgi:uncharacterized membrane protein YkvI
MVFIIIMESSRNDQQYTLIVPLLYSIYWLLHVSAVACHHQEASSELLEVQSEWVVYHTMCGYVACEPECCASQLSTYALRLICTVRTLTNNGKCLLCSTNWIIRQNRIRFVLKDLNCCKV